MSVIQKTIQYLSTHWGPLLVISLGGLLYVGADIYWREVCAVTGCSQATREYYLRPLLEIGPLIAVTACLFVFLPQNYFSRWFIFILVPLVLIYFRSEWDQELWESGGIVNTDTNTIAVGLILTISFIVSRFVTLRQFNIFIKVLLIVGIVIVGFIAFFLTDPFLRNGLLNML